MTQKPRPSWFLCFMGFPNNFGKFIENKAPMIRYTFRFLFASLCLLVIFNTSLAQSFAPKIGLNLNGHNGKVHEIIPFDDYQKFISISEDKTIKVWDTQSLEVIDRIDTEIGPGFEGIFYAGALDPTETYLALGGLPVSYAEGTYILVLNIKKKEVVAIGYGHFDVISDLSWDDTGKYLFSGGADNLFNTWSFDGTELTKISEIEMADAIQFIDWDKASQTVAVTSYDEVVSGYLLSDLASNGGSSKVKELASHKAPVNNVAFAADGTLVTTSTIGDIMINSTGTKPKTIREPDGTYFSSLLISPDDRYIVLFDEQGKAHVYNLKSGGLVNTLNIHDNFVFSAGFVPKDGQYEMVSSGGINHAIVRWNVETGDKQSNEAAVGQAIYSLATVDSTLLQINTYENGHKQPVSRSFNYDFFALSEYMKFDGSAFDDNKSYRQEDEYTINIRGGSKIYNDVNTDGRILSIASNGDQFFIGSDFSLKEYTKKGELVREFAGHIGGVRGLTLSKDGRYLISGGEDQKVIFWNLSEEGEYPAVNDFFNLSAYNIDASSPLATLARESTLKKWQEFAARVSSTNPDLAAEVEDIIPYLYKQVDPFLNLYLANNGEWISWTPKGYFNCSDYGSELFGWHVNRGLGKPADFYTAEQFFDILFAPDLINESLVTGQRIDQILQSRGKAVINLDFSKRPSVALFNRTPMRLRQIEGIQYQNEAYSTELREIPLEVELYNGGSGFEELFLYQNGKLIQNDTDLKEVSLGDYISKKYTVKLNNDINVFEVFVKNKSGVDSKRDVFSIAYKGQVIPTSSLHVISIGINEYKNNRYNLNYAYADAQSFVDQIKQVGKKIYKAINVYEVYNEEATKEGIMELFQQVSAKAQPEDVLIFYYAGHGTLDDESSNQEYYIVPTDVTQLYGDPEQLANKAVSSTELKEQLAGISAQKQMLLLDACHSGAAVKTLSTRSAASEEKAMIQLARNTGSVMIASSGSQQFATEFEILKHGVFTFSLLDALRGEGDNGDKNITVLEIKQYMEEKVPELTEKYGGSAQYPTGFVRGRNFPIGVLEDQ